MTSRTKTLYIIAAALLLFGLPLLLRACHEERPLQENAATAENQNSNKSQNINTAAEPQSAKAVMPSAPPLPSATPPPAANRVDAARRSRESFAVVRPPLPSSERRAVAAKRTHIPIPPAVGTEVASPTDYLEDRAKLVDFDRLIDLHRAVRLRPTPSALIAEAKVLLRLGNVATKATLSALSGESATEGGSEAYLRAAVLNAQRAVELIDATPAPPTQTEKAQLEMMRIQALDIQAQALSALVLRGDRTQTEAAEAAYREYIAAERDASKMAKAENELGGMLYATGQLEKAKAIYERTLARDPDNLVVLATLEQIMRSIGHKQELAGQKTEAANSYEAAAAYSERLQSITAKKGVEVNNRTTTGTTTTSTSTSEGTKLIDADRRLPRLIPDVKAGKLPPPRPVPVRRPARP